MAGYINKSKKGNVKYDIHDKRIPDITEEDVGKVPVVGENGNFEYADAPTGGAGGGVYEVVPEDFDVQMDGNLRSLPIASITIIGEDLITAIEEGYDLVIDMQDQDLRSIFGGCYFPNLGINTLAMGKYRFKFDEAMVFPYGNNGGGGLSEAKGDSPSLFANLRAIGDVPEIKSYVYRGIDLYMQNELTAGIMLMKLPNEDNWKVGLQVSYDRDGDTNGWQDNSSGGGGEE